jgi:hypothetical protein
MNRSGIRNPKGAKELGLPAPIIKPLKEYVELKGGGFTTRDMARKLHLPLADPPPPIPVPKR